MKYTPSRGGHAPGHLRRSFLDCLESNQEPWYALLGDSDTLFFYNAQQQARWHRMTLPERARWLTGQLWNCTDTLPESICWDLDIEEGSSYAMAARKLRLELYNSDGIRSIIS
jgi:hypothetical protein